MSEAKHTPGPRSTSGIRLPTAKFNEAEALADAAIAKATGSAA